MNEFTHEAWWTILLIVFALGDAFLAGYSLARGGKWVLSACLAVLLLVLAAFHIIHAGGHL